MQFEQVTRLLGLGRAWSALEVLASLDRPDEEPMVRWDARQARAALCVELTPRAGTAWFPAELADVVDGEPAGLFRASALPASSPDELEPNAAYARVLAHGATLARRDARLIANLGGSEALKVTGRSYEIALAVAAWSRLAGRTIPNRFAFTGALRFDGRLIAPSARSIRCKLSVIDREWGAEGQLLSGPTDAIESQRGRGFPTFATLVEFLEANTPLSGSDDPDQSPEQLTQTIVERADRAHAVIAEVMPRLRDLPPPRQVLAIERIARIFQDHEALSSAAQVLEIGLTRVAHSADSRVRLLVLRSRIEAHRRRPDQATEYALAALQIDPHAGDAADALLAAAAAATPHGDTLLRSLARALYLRRSNRVTVADRRRWTHRLGPDVVDMLDRHRVLDTGSECGPGVLTALLTRELTRQAAADPPLDHLDLQRWLEEVEQHQPDHDAMRRAVKSIAVQLAKTAPYQTLTCIVEAAAPARARPLAAAIWAAIARHSASNIEHRGAVIDAARCMARLPVHAALVMLQAWGEADLRLHAERRARALLVDAVASALATRGSSLDQMAAQAAPLLVRVAQVVGHVARSALDAGHVMLQRSADAPLQASSQWTAAARSIARAARQQARLSLAEEVLSVTRQRGARASRSPRAWVLSEQGRASLVRGDVDGARALFARVVALRRLAPPGWRAGLRLGAALVELASASSAEEAARAWQEALTVLPAQGGRFRSDPRPHRVAAMMGLGKLAASRGDRLAARERLTAALQLAQACLGSVEGSVRERDSAPQRSAHPRWIRRAARHVTHCLAAMIECRVERQEQRRAWSADLISMRVRLARAAPRRIDLKAELGWAYTLRVHLGMDLWSDVQASLALARSVARKGTPRWPAARDFGERLIEFAALAQRHGIPGRWATWRADAVTALAALPSSSDRDSLLSRVEMLTLPLHDEVHDER